MKKPLFMIIGIIAISLSTVSAKNLPAVAAKLPSDLKEAITQEIDYPDFADESMTEGEVWMKVTVTKDDKVKIVDLSATQPELGEYVEQELSDLYIPNSGVQSGQLYFLKLEFDLINK